MVVNPYAGITTRSFRYIAGRQSLLDIHISWFHSDSSCVTYIIIITVVLVIIISSF